MIKEVIRFCALGVYLEDYYRAESSDYFSDQDSEKLKTVIESEIVKVGVPEYKRLLEEMFRESIEILLSNKENKEMIGND